MAQATSPSMPLPDGHHHNHHNTPNMKPNPELPIDPSIAASSPTYPGPYSPYAPQGHDMSHYQGHAPPQGYGQWPPPGYGHPHGLPGGPYSSAGTAVSAGGAAATAGPRPGQVCTLMLPMRACSYFTCRILTLFPRSTPSFPFPVLSSINAPVAATRRLSACTSVDGTGVRKRTAH